MTKLLKISAIVITISAIITTSALWSSSKEKGTFYAVVHGSNNDGALLKSSNGKRWKEVDDEIVYNHMVWSIAHGKGTFVIGCFDGAILRSSNGKKWEIVKNGGHRLNAITYGKGRYVAVGRIRHNMKEKPLAAWSDDGKNWHDVIIDKLYKDQGNESLSSVAYGNGVFSAVGNGGRKVWSPDGKTWHDCRKGYENHRKVIFAGDRFVAAGSQGRFIWSKDGRNWVNEVPMDWKKRRLRTPDTTFISDMAWGNNTIVTIGMGGYVRIAKIAENSIPYSMVIDKKMELQAIAFGKGLFVALDGRGKAYYSRDGKKWKTAKAPLGNFRTLTYDRGKFIAVTGSVAMVSSNGITWRKVKTLASGQSLNAVTYGKDKFIAVGDGGRHIWTKDGIRWHDDDTLSFHVTNMSYGNGIFIAAGMGGRYAWSKDGRDWKIVTSSGPAFNGIAYGNGIFVAVGSAPFATGSRRAWTRDGIKWNNDLRGRGGFDDVVFGQNKFVAVGAGGWLTWTSDGIRWKNSQGGSAYIHCITYGSGRYIAFSEKGKIFQSNDAVTWQQTEDKKMTRMYTAGYGAGTYVAGGSNGMLFHSKDGKKWKEASYKFTRVRKDQLSFSDVIFVEK